MEMLKDVYEFVNMHWYRLVVEFLFDENQYQNYFVYNLYHNIQYNYFDVEDIPDNPLISKKKKTNHNYKNDMSIIS